jgi:tRNA threonylcarbamoyladenosine biosynthesis protein TsaE
VARVIELAAATPEDTRDLGEAVADLLGPGDVVLLTGDLGAGKTTFVQGAARGLGVADPVVSPTFTLVRQYRGRLQVFHADVYRLDRMQEAIELGFEEMVGPDGVLFVEWGDVVGALMPEARLDVEMWVRPEEDGRLVLLAGSGRSWAERWERLEGITQRWAAGPSGEGEPT